jgi:hypothetical protein
MVVEVLSLLGTHLPPLSAQFAALLRRHLPESPERLPHPLLLFGRQTLELLPSLAQNLALVGRHGAPLTESLLCARPLFRGHGQPPLAAFGERLLTIGWKRVPPVLIVLQEVLLLGRQ